MEQNIAEKFAEFIKICQNCQACDLALHRQHVVVYRGSITAPLMIVGEGPGANEDSEGLPFVGRSGKLLDALLQSFEFTEKDFHIANIVKCRPPQNRAPFREEAEICKKLLAKQILLVRPKVFLLMGATAYKYFTYREESISKVRGQWLEHNGYYIMPTYHPAYALRDPRRKPVLWEDMAKVCDKLVELGLKAPLQTVLPKI